MTGTSRRISPFGVAARFWGDRRGASAVEFAIVASPFIVLTLGILQVGIYYMAQSSLDAGVVRTADALRRSFATKTVTTFPSASTLKSNVASYSGGLVRNDGSLKVEIRQLVTLDAAILPIADGVADYGAATSTLVLRASTSVTTFAPGFSRLAQATSSAIVRRQGR